MRIGTETQENKLDEYTLENPQFGPQTLHNLQQESLSPSVVWEWTSQSGLCALKLAYATVFAASGIKVINATKFNSILTHWKFCTKKVSEYYFI